MQAHPEIRQYKVMVFGSRRLSLQNRRFLRRYEPVHVPDDAPLGLPKRLKPSFPRSEVFPEAAPTMRSSATPSPEVSLGCDPGCCTRPTQSQQSQVQVQTTAPVQRQVQPTLPQVPVTVVHAPDAATATPVRTPETTPVPTPSIPCPAPCSEQPPAPAATPRRSTRAGRGRHVSMRTMSNLYRTQQWWGLICSLPYSSGHLFTTQNQPTTGNLRQGCTTRSTHMTWSSSEPRHQPSPLHWWGVKDPEGTRRSSRS